MLRGSGESLTPDFFCLIQDSIYKAVRLNNDDRCFG